MFPLPYLSLFFSSLILSTFLALSANQWLFIWMALELNLLSFIPLLTMSKQFQETEAAVKYFLAQALGSGMILLGLSLSLNSYSSSLSPIITYLSLTIGILLKTGIPPCHFWFPSVMSSLSWPLCFILSTWQKLIPMSILIFSLSSLNYSPFMTIIAALSALTGGMGGINQTQLRPLLAYSSITHMAWILALSPLSSINASIYLLTYILISSSVIFMLNTKKMFSVKSTSTLLLFNSPHSIFVMMILLSLGGLPPLLGFFPKWMALSSLINNNQIFLSFSLIIGSLLSLYYYLTLAFSMSLSSNLSLLPPKITFSASPTFLFLMSTATFPLMPVIFSLL